MSRIAKSISIMAIVLILGLGLVSAALASGGGGEAAAHHANKSAALTDLLYRFINFALLVIILAFALKKANVGQLFASRREKIQKTLEELKAAKEAAERRYRELEEKLKAFEKEKEKILEQFRAEGAAEKERIIAEAKERAKQILEQAEFTIKREIEEAKNRARQEVVELAAIKAQEIISRQIKDDDQERLVNEFIEKVERLH